MIPGSGGTQRALRLIGMTRAKLFMMTGQRIPAERAEAWGLITQAVPNDELDDAVGALAGELAERAPLALRTLKMVLNRGAEAPLETALELERKAYAWLRSTHDYEEGVHVVPREAAAEVPRGDRRMSRASFGLTLANRAVVLGAIKARDLIDLTVEPPRRRAPSTRCGWATACSPSRAWRRSRCSRRWPARRRGCAWASAAWRRSSIGIR